VAGPYTLLVYGRRTKEMFRRMPSVPLATAIMLVSVALAVVVLLLSNIYDGGAPVGAQTSPQPNFVFIIADDMRYDDLKYMPKTTTLLGEQGMTFSRAYFANPFVAPPALRY
jgi:hypothetical protein